MNNNFGTISPYRVKREKEMEWKEALLAVVAIIPLIVLALVVASM